MNAAVGFKYRRELSAPAFMEFIGTAILAGSVQMSSHETELKKAQVVLAALLALTYMGLDISGAHYNPAITITFFLSRQCPLRSALVYVIAQIAGGVFGAVLARFVSNEAAFFSIGEKIPWQEACAVEFVFTTVLCFVVLVMNTRSNSDIRSFYGVIIASIVYAGNSIFSYTRTTSFNPAMSIGLSFSKGSFNLPFALLVVTLHVLAAFMAFTLFSIVLSEERQIYLKNPQHPNVCDETSSLLKT